MELSISFLSPQIFNGEVFELFILTVCDCCLCWTTSYLKGKRFFFLPLKQGSTSRIVITNEWELGHTLQVVKTVCKTMHDVVI